MNRTVLFLLALALAPISGWGQTSSRPAYWRYVHPSAKMIAGVDLTAAAGSPMGLHLKKEMEQLGMKKTISGQGMDFLFDADQLLISSPAEGTAAMAAKTDTPVVIAMRGQFVLPTIRKAALGQGAIPGIYRGITILRTDQNDKAMTLALVSPQIIVAGDRASVHAAIDSALAATSAPGTDVLYQKAMALAKDNEVWFISETSPAMLAGAGTPQTQMLGEVASLAGGISFKRGLGIHFNLNAKSAESATKLGAGLQAMLALAAMGGPTDSPKGATDLLQKLQIGASGDQVSIAVNYSMEEIERGMSELKAEMMAPPKVQATGQPVPRVAAAPPAPREDPNRPMVVKIYNADGGPQQVDIKNK